MSLHSQTSEEWFNHLEQHDPMLLRHIEELHICDFGTGWQIGDDTSVWGIFEQLLMFRGQKRLRFVGRHRSHEGSDPQTSYGLAQFKARMQTFGQIDKEDLE